MKSTIYFICLSTLLLQLMFCSTNDDDKYEDLPSVAGIHITTVDAPDGLGTIYGSPSYSIGDTSVPLNLINIYPNPYLATHSAEPSRDNKFIFFSHLDTGMTAEIFVAKYKNDESTVSATIEEGNPIRSITFDAENLTGINNRYLWDLNTDADNYIETGFYRIIFSDHYDNSHHVDAYIILPDAISDCSEWDDPTGWLPADWKINSYFRNICPTITYY